ncbi:MAG: acyl-CoA dehydrogenase [Gemmatimonadales bacterium]|nr:MAG: acyl-CoA dehydrogenase [Gemmatimonadales bacterium]
MPDVAAVRAFLEERHLGLASGITEFCTRHIRPLPEPRDDSSSRSQAREILALLGGGGWLEPIGRLDLRACCLIREALAAASPLADSVFALQALGTVPLVLAGETPAAARWVQAALSGKAMAAFAMTEPGAGSDVSAIATEAKEEGGGYVLSGTKSFISNAGIADFYTVFASTDRSKGRDGISCFVVDAATEGLAFVRPQIMSAPHPLGEIEFRNCTVSGAARLGAEGEGLRLGLRTLELLRVTVGAAACGMAERALEEALNYATARRQFGQPLAEFQLIQQKLAQMATELAAARLLVYRAAFDHDQGAARVRLQSAMAKYFATEAAQRIVDQAVQILGGRGVMADHPVDRLYRSVRALRIYEGTSEIQQLVIARELLRGRREE